MCQYTYVSIYNKQVCRNSRPTGDVSLAIWRVGNTNVSPLHCSDILPKPLVPVMTVAVNSLRHKVHPEYLEEMKGFAQGFNITLGELFTFNLIYDLSQLVLAIISIVL